MNHYIKKIYFSLFLSFMCVLTTVTCTFAFLRTNKNVLVDQFSLNIGGKGTNSKKGDLVLSVDGVNFSDTLSEYDLKKAILKSRGYNSFNMDNNSINTIYNREVRLLDVTPTNYLDLTKGFNTLNHYDSDVTSSGVISFDLYVSTTNQNYTDGNYLTLYFSEELMTEGCESVYSDLLISLEDTHPTLGKIPQTIKVNAANALRLGVVTYDTMDKGVVRDTNQLTSQIYRFDDNVCSSTDTYNFGGITPKFIDTEAGTVQVSPDDANYSEGYTFNTMQKYYNVIMNEKITDDRFNDSSLIYRDTYDKYIYNSNIIDTSYKLTYNKMVKLKIYLWIEGWDSDCFNVILKSKISLDLLFTTYSSDEENL